MCLRYAAAREEVKMPITFVLVSLVAGYAALAALTRRLKRRWNAAGNVQKLRQAGFLALLSSLQTLFQTALIAIGGATLLLAGAWLISPFLAGAALQAGHAAAAHVSGWIDAIKGTLAAILLWLVILALIWFLWRTARGQLGPELRREHDAQLAQLTKLRLEGRLYHLEPSSEMRAVLAQLQKFINPKSGKPEVPAGMNPDAAVAQYKRLITLLLSLDLERRIDLTKVQVSPIPDVDTRSWWPRIRIFAFSKGTTKTLGWLSRMASKASTAAACLLILGVAGPTIAAAGLQPYLSYVEDLQIARSRDDAEASLAAIFAPPAQQSPDAVEPSPAAYSAVANAFLNNISTAPEFRDPPAPSPPPSSSPQRDGMADAAATPPDIGAFALEDTILHEAAADERAAPMQVVSEGGGSAPAEDFAGYARVLDRLRADRPPAGGRIVALLRAAAARYPRVKAAIRSFHEPAELWDYGSTAFSHVFEAAAEAALPEVPHASNPFEGRPWASARKGFEAATEHLVRERIARFLDRLRGGSVDAALADLDASRPPAGGFTQAEAGEVNEFLGRISAERSALAATLPTAPTLELAAQDSDRAWIDRMLPLVREDDQAVARTALGDYDDLFPGSAVGRATTSYQQSLRSVAQTRTSLAVLTSRNWVRLDAHPDVGGVILGRSPADVGSFADLIWRQRSGRFDLALVDAQGIPHPIGSFSPQMIQQAIAYAADGRLTAVTVTGGWVARRVQLHPVFEGTELGCDILQLDELVYAETENDRDLRRWEQRVRDQVRIYNLAVAALANGGHGPSDYPTASTFDGWRADDKDSSVLAHYRTRFERQLVAAIDNCQPSAAGEDATNFWNCVSDRSLGLQRPAQIVVGFRSGVREPAYSMQDGAFAASGPSGSGTWPLEFEHLAIIEGPVAADAQPEVPWTFPPLNHLAQRSVEARAARDPATASLIGRLRQFTLLQRVVRLGLQGHLGPAFPRTRLLQLFRTARAADSIPLMRTPIWDERKATLTDLQNGLIRALPAASRRLADIQSEWMEAAPDAGVALEPCLEALRTAQSTGASNDPQRIDACQTMLAQEGFNYRAVIDGARAMLSIHELLQRYGDRLRDTSQCRTVG
jgi:YD repeat-containing protein